MLGMLRHSSLILFAGGTTQGRSETFGLGLVAHHKAGHVHCKAHEHIVDVPFTMPSALLQAAHYVAQNAHCGWEALPAWHTSH
jgi:hypothetical protein